jgi:hypothetical protein
VALGIVVAVWAVLVWRAVPVPLGDQGTFVTVAERLLAGDRLYLDVAENKDPLFHYVNAAFRIVGPFGTWALSLVLLGAASAAAYSISRSLGRTRHTSMLVGWGAAPLILAGSMYFAGTSEVPAVSVILLGVAAALWRRPLLAGIALGVLPWFKLVTAPIGVALILGAVLIAGRWPQLWRALIAAIGGWLSLAIIVSVRGEFAAYIAILQDNTGYASAALTYDPNVTVGRIEGIPMHLSRSLPPQALIGVVLGLALVLIALSRLASRRAGVRVDEWALAVVVLVGAAATLAVLALTGLWGHHAVMFSAVLIIGLIVWAGWQTGGPDLRRWPGLAGFAGIVWILAFAPQPGAYLDPLLYARANLNIQTQTPPETALILSTGKPTTFARVGRGNDAGFTYGLRDWTLACPIMIQESWQAKPLLDPVLECLPRANVIMIAKDAKSDANYEDWNAFLARVNDLTNEDYECRAAEAGTVCRRSGS